jgi:ribonuclease VapC
MILDSSAVLAIIFGEPGYELFRDKMISCTACSVSAATFVEISMVAESRAGDAGIRQRDSFFRNKRISIQPVSEEQAFLASQAFSLYGKGRHPAGLNFGDCFSYALAKATGEPLLFKGEDFLRTDIQPALPDNRSQNPT